MPIDDVDPTPDGNGLFGWVNAALDRIRDIVSPNDYQTYQRGPDATSTTVSDLTGDIRLLAIIAVGILILAALALLLALIAILRQPRNHIPPHVQPPEPWLQPGVQLYPTSGPVTQIGNPPGWHPADQQLNLTPAPDVLNYPAQQLHQPG